MIRRLMAALNVLLLVIVAAVAYWIIVAVGLPVIIGVLAAVLVLVGGWFGGFPRRL